MRLSEFINKFRSKYLRYNLLAMAGVVLLLCLALNIGLGIYTRHGQSVAIPDVRHKSMVEARALLEDAGLTVVVGDTGYVKELPADCVLEQSPEPGKRVKVGHGITLIVNASSTPTLTLPDIVDNSSSREALARLKAMGFKVGMPQFVDGEKDWVYGVLVDGQARAAGDRIPVSKTVVIQIGNGMLSPEDSVNYIDYDLYSGESRGGDRHDVGEVDDFVEIP